MLLSIMTAHKRIREIYRVGTFPEVIACGASHTKENKFIFFSSIYGKVFYFFKNNLI